MEKVKHFIHGVGDKLGFGKPTASINGFHLPSITADQADVVVDVLINNPNPIPVPLIEVAYNIESDGRKLISGTIPDAGTIHSHGSEISGTIPDAGTIHSHGSETVKIPITLIYKDIKEMNEDIKPGQVIPYLARIDLIIDVPVIGRITLPLQKTGELPVPHKPDVDIEKVEWDHLSMDETAATLHLKIDNKNKFKLGVTHLSYDVALANMPIASANLSRSSTIESESVGLMHLPITFRPMDFGSALWDIIRGKEAGYTMRGNLEVDTPFGPMHLPFAREGGKTLFRKKGEQ